MKTQQKQVAEWMRKFSQEVRDVPTIPPLEERKLRAKLILEEALETIDALGFDVNYDIVWRDIHTPKENQLEKIADGIADSLVVQLGTAVACGIDIEPVFAEVMRSNDSKLWSIKDLEILEQINDHEGKHKVTGEIYDVTCVDIVRLLYGVADKDGKVIKSPSYSPAKILI